MKDTRKLLKQAALTAGIPLAMLAMAYAAVPLYDLFCRVTGFGGTTQVATEAPTLVSGRTLEIRFDANVAPGLPLEFQPSERAAQVRIGETGLAFYTLENTGDRPLTIVANYNVTPFKTGQYFQKLECFCFRDMVVKPGEKLELPVVFFVSSALEEDGFASEVRTITLSYTFFESAAQQAQASGSVRLAALGGPVGAR